MHVNMNSSSYIHKCIPHILQIYNPNLILAFSIPNIIFSHQAYFFMFMINSNTVILLIIVKDPKLQLILFEYHLKYFLMLSLTFRGMLDYLATDCYLF